MSNDKLLSIIIQRLDPDEIIDTLGLDSEELTKLLKYEILQNRDKFEDYLSEYMEAYDE